MIEAIDHVNIVVSDLERSVQFYTGLLGFKVQTRIKLSGSWIDGVTGLEDVRADVVYLTAPDGVSRIELLKYHRPVDAGEAEPARPNRTGLRHLALRVRNIEEAVARLKEAGVEFFSGPVAVPEGVLKRKAGRKRLCYFRDPDGVILELAEYR